MEAVTGLLTPISEAEVSKTNDGLVLVSSPREIWLIDVMGTKKKVSPSNVDAFFPVISANGKLIAFTGRQLDRNGIPSTQKVYVGDPIKRQYRTFQTNEHLENYHVTPIDWIENDSVLRVIQDYGETGGRMTLMKIPWNK